jgi:hypothetical protein
VSYEWPVPFRYANKSFTYVSHQSHVCYMTCPSLHPWFNQFHFKECKLQKHS